MAIAFKNASVNIQAAATQTLVIQAPVGKTHVIFSLHLANTSANNRRVTIELYDDSASTTGALGKDVLIPTENTLSWDGKIVLEENDILYVTADLTAGFGDIVATAHILEQ